ncbi:Ger(x)C family spore germination protein [Bacillus luteolus]|uniref:Ger(X)C family spore germination protein n=1 Tax=Litchfieldia luteola TaxID=682179 RepID=A0ABR9QF73_9BACI|nr:Ger(x)C family spore germination protein [Cytobacillus luteolus]MBE4906899.1 Ger(x)C family spore germination protein [Cytobacillus luteolus]MBP1943638.1 spore germination protein [Cytobacillus luteolus]
MKKLLIISSAFILLVITLVFGSVRTEIIDEINIVTAIGFDRAEEGKIRGTCVIPVFKADKSVENEQFTEESYLAKEVINILQKKSADPLVTGGIRAGIYSEALARDGIIEYVDALQRDASIGSKMYMGIVEGETTEMLNQTLGNLGTGNYLATLIEHNTQNRDLPESILHTFMFRYFAQGMDPYLPMLKLEGNKVKMTGIGIFKEDTLVDKISEADMFFFKALVENFGAGSYTLNLKGTDEYAAIKRIKSTRTINVEESNGGTLVSIKVSLDGILSEYSGRKAESDVVKKIVKEMEDLIEEKSYALIKRFQEKGTDPVGIGFSAENAIRDFDPKKWKDDYGKLKVDIEADVILTETGVIE